MPCQPKYLYTEGLESNRLLTRFLTFADAPAWSEFFRDEEAVALMPPSVTSPGGDPARTWIEKQLRRYHEKTFGLQAIIDKASGQLVGQCGLLLQVVDGREELEVGYHMIRRFWGCGYAPEAARLFIDYAFANELSDTVISIIDVRNDRSMRVAEKNGLVREKESVWNGAQRYIYRIGKGAG
jgi:[ribosomal protein S5]-alanine N-acetyltransferase